MMQNAEITKKRMKKRYVALIVVLVIIVTAGIWFYQFIPFGYRMSVPIRRFSEVAPNVYIHKDFSGDRAEAVRIIDEAEKRVEGFFGEITSNPMIILCDDEKTIDRLGGDHDTRTIGIIKVYSCISLSSEFLNVDVAAHELTHAETHKRVYNGRIFLKPLIPVWFDEGVATQNDFRAKYDENAWRSATNNGENLVVLTEFAGPDKFYAGGDEVNKYLYTLSRHELKEWIERNGVGALLELLDGVNHGEDFNELYFER